MGPLAYLITFRCYGTWLCGDPRGYTARDHAAYGTPLATPNPPLWTTTAGSLSHDPVVISARMRGLVDSAIREHCAHAGWGLLALNVRRTHVHAVVRAERAPERVMLELKAWSTRKLVGAGALPGGARPWGRHGSTRWLWTTEALEAACRYVLEGQGAALAMG